MSEEFAPPSPLSSVVNAEILRTGAGSDILFQVVGGAVVFRISSWLDSFFLPPSPCFFTSSLS